MKRAQCLRDRQLHLAVSLANRSSHDRIPATSAGGLLATPRHWQASEGRLCAEKGEGMPRISENVKVTSGTTPVGKFDRLIPNAADRAAPFSAYCRSGVRRKAFVLTMCQQTRAPERLRHPDAESETYARHCCVLMSAHDSCRCCYASRPAAELFLQLPVPHVAAGHQCNGRPFAPNSISPLRLR